MLNYINLWKKAITCDRQKNETKKNLTLPKKIETLK